MRRAICAAVLLSLLAVVSAGDVSKAKPLTGRLTCILPISKLTCVRDWRSGFVAGLKYSYEGFDSLGPDTVGGSSANQQWAQVCSTRIFNQTSFDMSAPGSIDNAVRDSPAWYKNLALNDTAIYLYPRGAPITQVIVLTAANPFGVKFGTIAAILFGFQTEEGLDFAVCGNPVYARAYLDPANNDAPPTPVTLKASYTSGLSDDGVLTALGSFDGKCATRGGSFSAYHGGDPWKSSKFYLKKFEKPCFTAYNNTVFNFTSTSPQQPKRIWAHFECDEDNDVCNRPCFYDKKNNKKSPSYSCVMNGNAMATGKHGAIQFDHYGNSYDWEYDSDGKLQQVKAGDVYEGEPWDEEEDEESN